MAFTYRRLSVLLFLFQAGVFCLNSAGASYAPVNDAFTNALPLAGAHVEWISTNLFATAEPGEPRHCGYGASQSVWYRWTSPQTGMARIQPTNQTTRARCAVYAGSVLT